MLYIYRERELGLLYWRANGEALSILQQRDGYGQTILCLEYIIVEIFKFNQISDYKE